MKIYQLLGGLSIYGEPEERDGLLVFAARS